MTELLGFRQQNVAFAAMFLFGVIHTESANGGVEQGQWMYNEINIEVRPHRWGQNGRKPLKCRWSTNMQHASAAHRASPYQLRHPTLANPKGAVYIMRAYVQHKTLLVKKLHKRLTIVIKIETHDAPCKYTRKRKRDLNPSFFAHSSTRSSTWPSPCVRLRNTAANPRGK